MSSFAGQWALNVANCSPSEPVVATLGLPWSKKQEAAKLLKEQVKLDIRHDGDILEVAYQLPGGKTVTEKLLLAQYVNRGWQAADMNMIKDWKAVPDPFFLSEAVIQASGQWKQKAPANVQVQIAYKPDDPKRGRVVVTRTLVDPNHIEEEYVLYSANPAEKDKQIGTYTRVYDRIG